MTHQNQQVEPLAPPFVLAEGKITFSLEEARQTVGGYVFARQPLPLSYQPVVSGETAPEEMTRARWACAVYDFQPGDLGPLNYFDIVVSIGLNSQINTEAIAGMLEIAPLVSEAIAHVPVSQTFWELSVDEVAEIPSDSSAWWMNRAVELLVAVDGVGPTVAHKTLHHKRPWLFPLLDDETTKYMRYVDSWNVIHRDLTNHDAQFQALEQFIADEVASRGGVPLSRLRIHDILVWTTMQGQRIMARDAGAALGF